MDPRRCRDAPQGEGKGMGATQTIARCHGHVTTCQGGRNYFPTWVPRNHRCNPRPAIRVGTAPDSWPMHGSCTAQTH